MHRSIVIALALGAVLCLFPVPLQAGGGPRNVLVVMNVASEESLEIGRYGLGFAKDFNKRSLDDLMSMLTEPSSERQFIMYEALRKGADVQTLYETTYIKPWFIEQMKELVELEEEVLKRLWEMGRRGAG